MGLFSKKEVLRFDNEKVQNEMGNILGTPADHVYHSPVPFHFGHEAGGRSDVYLFDKHLKGFVYVTGDLIGEKQKKSDAGNYELMVCHREKDTDWGINLICEFAFYTLQASINSYETMSLEDGPYSSDGYSVKHLLFHKYADFSIDKERIGLMLLIGITQQEWDWGGENGNEELVKMLKEKKVYPFTDLYRESIV